MPTYNHCDDLLKPCLESVFKYTNMADVELIVSANGCTDNTKSYLDSLKSQFDAIGFSDNFRVIWHDEPLGFPKANNVALRVARGKKIVLLNNDTILLGQNRNHWLDLLNGEFEKNEKCGISCVLKNYSPAVNRYFAVFFCVMIDRKVFDKIGLLNEEYGTGSSEDIEFCIEAENAGFEVRNVFEKFIKDGQQVTSFPIYHKGEGTVHDATLIPNWNETYEENLKKVAAKYNDQSIKESLAWISDIGPEAKELYDEVIRDNIYRISSGSLKNRDVIDIGANMGTFSIFASKLGANKVIAVEPVSDTIRMFKANMQTAGATNIILKQNVASNKTGEVVKMALQDKCGHNSAYMPSEHYEEVQTISFKDLMALTDSDNIFLKMDCEGGEYDILMDADPEDMKRISTVAIEIHGDLHPKYKGVSIMQQKLFEFGYKLVDRKQIGCWDGIDQNGNRINYRDLPLTQEEWSR